MINIDSIATALKENRMAYNVTQGCCGESIFLTHNLRSYRVETEDNKIKLLEFNLAANQKKKNRYRFVNSYTNIEFMVEYIKNRYMLKKAI